MSNNNGAVLVARCENYHEPDGPLCTGELRFRWGMSQAACGTCGAWCGVAVAAWTRVENPPALESEAETKAAYEARWRIVHGALCKVGRAWGKNRFINEGTVACRVLSDLDALQSPAPANPQAEGAGETDELAHVGEGDPDPTPDAFLTDVAPCSAARSRPMGPFCTRPEGHPGQHLAGGGYAVGIVHAVWPAS